jgi:hypothetical protein
MADEVHITTDLDALFGGIANEVIAIVQDEILSTADTVVADAKRRMPRKTGATAGGLHVETYGDGYRVLDAVPYSGHVHRAGTKTLAVDELVVGPLVASFSEGGEAIERLADRLSRVGR